MKVYGIATETHECYGHGDYGNEQRICRTQCYGTGPFPPFFERKETAELWIKENTAKTVFGPLSVVELELLLKPEGEMDRLRKHNAALIYNRDKTDAEFMQVTGLLEECRRVLHELQCYDQDFYDRTCHGLINAIDTHLTPNP